MCIHTITDYRYAIQNQSLAPLVDLWIANLHTSPENESGEVMLTQEEENQLIDLATLNLQDLIFTSTMMLKEADTAMETACAFQTIQKCVSAISHAFLTRKDELHRTIVYVKQMLDEQKDEVFARFVLRARLDRLDVLYLQHVEKMRNLYTESFLPTAQEIVQHAFSVEKNTNDVHQACALPIQILKCGPCVSVEMELQKVFVPMLFDPSTPSLVIVDLLSFLLSTEDGQLSGDTSYLRQSVYDCIASEFSCLDRSMHILDMLFEKGESQKLLATQFLFFIAADTCLSEKSLLSSWKSQLEHHTREWTLSDSSSRKIIVRALDYANDLYTAIQSQKRHFERELVQVFKIVKRLLRSFPRTIHSHISHYVPYVIVNMCSSSDLMFTNEALSNHVRGILQFCIRNSKESINYISNIADEGVLGRMIDSYQLDEICIVRQQLFTKLVEEDAEMRFVDQLQSTFILKPGFLPLANGERQLCDQYVLQSILCTQPTNPYTREDLSVESFIAFQDKHASALREVEAERREFVKRHK